MKVPSPRTAARRMCAADVPTAFPRSAADWRTGRGADSIRLSPRAADARSAGGAADVPTDFLRSAADWRQGVHSERGKESTRSAARSPLGARQGVHSERGKESTRSAARARRGQRKLPKPSAAVCRQASLSENAALGFPPLAGRLAPPWTLPLPDKCGGRRGVTSPRTAAGCDFPKDGGGV